MRVFIFLRFKPRCAVPTKPCTLHTKLAKIREIPLFTQQLHKAGIDFPSSAIAFDFTIFLVDFSVMNFLQEDVSGFLKRT